MLRYFSRPLPYIRNRALHQNRVLYPPLVLSQTRHASFSSRFKELGKKYGATSVVVYLTMSTTTFSIIFVAIRNGIDVEKHLVNAKAYVYEKILGQTPPESNSTTEDDATTEYEKEEDILKKNKWTWKSLGTTFVVAFAANKLLSPLKAMLTMVITPTVAKWWRIKRLK
ncbi:hypothetical protein MP638_003693 [Amoeboaphelidium occidentale]|nr:hypothetical protein MP638_003693 [Amoeboaphelidium occidentale]